MAFDMNSILTDNKLDEDKLKSELEKLNGEQYKEAALLIVKQHYRVLKFISYEKLGKDYSEVAGAAITLQASALGDIKEENFIKENISEYGKLVKKAVLGSRQLIIMINKLLLTEDPETFANILSDEKTEVRLNDFPKYLQTSAELDQLVKEHNKAYKFVMLNFLKKYPVYIELAHEHKQYLGDELQILNKKNQDQSSKPRETIQGSVESSKPKDTQQRFFESSSTSTETQTLEISPKSENSSLDTDEYNKAKAMILNLNKEINSSWPYPNKDRKKEKVRGLTELITRTNEGQDVKVVVEDIIKKYPELMKGIFSKRTAEFIEGLKASHTARPPI